MKIIFIVLFALVLVGKTAMSQELFPSKQLTFDAAQEGFACWFPDGRSIVYSYVSMRDSLGKNGLWKISLDDYTKTHLLTGISEHPQFSPDGKFILFDADSGNSIKMLHLKDEKVTNVLPDSIRIFRGGLPIWSPDGKWIAFIESQKSTLWIKDCFTGQLTKLFVKEGMLPIPGCWSKDGTSLYFSLREMQSRNSTLWKINIYSKQKEQIIPENEGFYRFVDVSPDGTLLAYAAFEERNLQIRIMPANGGKYIQLTSHSGFNESPRWSPDGKRITFTSTRSGNFDIWIMDVDIAEIKRILAVK